MCSGGFMTEKSIRYLKVLAKVKEKKISQKQAAEELNVSVRQIYRLYEKLLKDGPDGFISKKHGKPGNHQLPKITKARVLELFGYEKYEGFGPTFMSEKLLELHSIKISVETARLWMIECGVWHPHKEKRPKVHQQRQRRSRLGELVQIDGSHHRWFEGRGEACCLIVFIDDATGRTFGMLFETETTAAYMITLKKYMLKYKGLPNACYSDRHGIFKVNIIPNCTKEDSPIETQFGRACRELGMGLIWANSPQAKGRVERQNSTLQDRLVKEFRIAGISKIEQGNDFLETFWDKHNKRFSIRPADEEDDHLAPLSEAAVDRILCFKEVRIVTKNLEIQYDNTIFQVINKESRGLSGEKITVLESLDGKISFEYKNKKILLNKLSEVICEGKEVNSKEIDRFLKQRKTNRKPAWNHPMVRGRRIKPTFPS